MVEAFAGKFTSVFPLDVLLPSFGGEVHASNAVKTSDWIGEEVALDPPLLFPEMDAGLGIGVGLGLGLGVGGGPTLLPLFGGVLAFQLSLKLSFADATNTPGIRSTGMGILSALVLLLLLPRFSNAANFEESNRLGLLI